MNIIFSKGYEASAVSDELFQLISDAYVKQGTAVEIPSAALQGSCFDLSSETSEEINTIRRRERTVSTETLSFSFA